MSKFSQEPILKTARREMLSAAVLWLVAMVWTVGYCAKYGYNLQPDQLKFVLGFPDWVFWGVVLPWGLCTLISGWFAFFYMQDADLGDTDDTPPPAEGDDARA